MQAVILAGGLGTRLRPLTGQIPKVMVPLAGKPFLSHLLELLKSQDICDIVLCIGYLGQQVRDFFGDGGSLGMSIIYSEEKEELLGTGGALNHSKSLLGNYFLVINGDTYLPVDYPGVEKCFLNRGKMALMVVYANREDTGVKNNVELNRDMMVTRHEKGSADPGLKHVEAGVLALRREALDLIDGDGPVSLEKGLYPKLIQRGELAACVTGQRFYDMGTPEQYRISEEFLKRKRR